MGLMAGSGIGARATMVEVWCVSTVFDLGGSEV
jgi:hypothetical protein